MVPHVSQFIPLIMMVTGVLKNNDWFKYPKLTVKINQKIIIIIIIKKKVNLYLNKLK